MAQKSREEGEIGSESREKGDLPPCSSPLHLACQFVYHQLILRRVNKSRRIFTKQQERTIGNFIQFKNNFEQKHIIRNFSSNFNHLKTRSGH